MRRLFKKIIPVICVLFAANLYAQQQAMQGRIIFRIKAEGVALFHSAFDISEISKPTFDPQTFSLRDAKTISSALGLPSSVRATLLKPFIPQHNVVLEELRERTNPILFSHTNTNGISIKEAEAITKLRHSEEKISRCFELFFDGDINVESVILLLKKPGIVEFAEPRYLYNTCGQFIPNDPRFAEQYSLPMIHAPEAWDIVRCDSTMLVADDDIGSDWTHSDLAKAAFVNKGETGFDTEGLDKRSNGIDDDGDGFIDDWHGWDFAGSRGISPDNDPGTVAKHGTHTAGIIAASGNNSIGICGVAFGAKILLLKCGDNNGNDVAFGYEGIIMAADMGAKVVNNSWGGSNRSQVGQDIVDYATSKNCVVVAASGNSSSFDNLYPASYDHVLSVGAVDESGHFTNFSNYNTRVDVSAPGNNVLSTIPNEDYMTMTGTSMASPNAAGAIALVRQKFPDLTPDQAMERLRATSDPLAIDQDIHPGYTGKGRINVKRAISENPVYSARLENVEIFDNNNDGDLSSGESADIVLHVRNYLSSVTDLVAKVEYLDTNNYITANTETIRFGKANTLSLVQNFQGSFHINVAANVPENYIIRVKLTFFSSPEGYGPDIDYFSLIINKGYLDLNKNNLTVTFDSKGSMGYNDPPNNSQGSGFVWTHAPNEIAVEGRDILSQAGLMIGFDENHIAASGPSDYSDAVAERDFNPVVNLHYVSPSDHLNAVQQLHTVFADKPDSLEVGVQVEQKMYAFAKDLSANAVVLDYVVHKRIENVSDALSAALFMDWDIGASGSINKAYVSSLDTAISVTRRMEQLYPFVGIKLISEIPEGAALNFYALNNDGSDGSARTYGGFSKSDKWLTLSTSRPLAGIGDVSMIYGLKDLPLLSQDSVRLTFVIALASSEQLLKQTIDQTQAAWFGSSGVGNIAGEGHFLTSSPNPFSNRMHISWKSDEPQTPAFIFLTDALGRTLINCKTEGSTFDLAGITLPAGMYNLTVRQGTSVLRNSVICLP